MVSLNAMEYPNFELRSEKVRHVIGQVPSTLIQYGVFSVVIALLVLFTISFFLPYKQVVNGVLVINEIKLVSVDSAWLSVEFKMPEERSSINPINCDVTLVTPEDSICGKVIKYDKLRTREGRNRAEVVLLKSGDVERLNVSEVDFSLTLRETTVFFYFISGLRI